MNKILAFSITIVLFVIHKISAQNYLNYYETINKAEIATLDKNFEISDSLYQIAFGLVDKPFKDDYLLASINSEKLNDHQKSYEYLKGGISYGLTLKRIKKELSKFKQSDQWKSLKREYDSIRKQYLNTLDLELREELFEMVRKDQAIRHPIFGSSKKLKKTDSENYIRLLRIIKENNGKWPGRFLIGVGNKKHKYDWNNEVTVMLHHFTKEQVNKLKPILIEAIMSGSLSPYNVAYPLDYKNSQKIGERKKGNIIYKDSCDPIGSYIRNNGNVVVICDCKKAEKERKKMGLESLDDYFRKRKVNYECYEKE